MNSDYLSMDNITDAVLEDQIVENLIDFFNWELLKVGAYFNVKRPTLKSKFRIFDDPNSFTTGVAWESKHPTGNWVWETVSRSPAPLTINGVYVNNSLITTGYNIDYRNGRIIFNSVKPSSTVVELEYTHRRFNFYEADADWFQQVVFDPLPTDTLNNILSENRVYLPAVIVESVAGGHLEGYQIGDYSVSEYFPILFHILSDNDEDRNKLLRIFKSLFQKTIWLYNTNEVANDDKFPLTPEGYVVASPLTYPELIDQYRWKRCQFVNVVPQDITPQLPLFRAVVRATLKIVMP